MASFSTNDYLPVDCIVYSQVKSDDFPANEAAMTMLLLKVRTVLELCIN